MRRVLQLLTTKALQVAAPRRWLVWGGVAAACVAFGTFRLPAQFTIVPPVREHWWLRMLALMLAAAATCALYRYRVARLLEMERLRTRIAADLHDDIGSTLSQIAILSEVAKRGVRGEGELEALSEIANLSRESVDSMSDIVWAIDPEQDRLRDLAYRMRRFAGDLFNGNGVRVQFRSPVEEQGSEIDPEKRRQIFLIFKETLHNIVRHSACTEVEIDFHLERGWLTLILRDNGKGFDVVHPHNGHGVTSMNQRATQLGGGVAVESVAGLGTTVRMRVPLTEGLLPRWKKFLHKRVASIQLFRRTLKSSLIGRWLHARHPCP